MAILILAVPGPASAAAQDDSLLPPITDKTLADVEEYLATQLEADGRDGLAAAIVRGDEIAGLITLGEAGAGVPATADTAFFLASVSKSITATVLMTAVDQGLVDLDQTVASYIPELSPEGDDITVRDVMHQHSGISTYLGNTGWTGDDGVNLQANLEAIAAELDPSAGFEYSNANYDLLALVVERASGQPFDEYAREHLFQPLDMATTFAGTPGVSTGLSEGHYHWLFLGYRPQDELTPAGLMGSAVMYSSAEDMAHFLITHLNEGRYQGQQVVAASSINLLHQGRSYGPDGVPEDYPVDPGYAGGLQVDASFPPGEVPAELAGLVTLWHDGSSIGHRTAIVMVPKVDLGLVLLTNGSDFANDPWIAQVSQGVKAILFGLEPFDPTPSGDPMMRWGKHLLLGIVILQVVLAVWAVGYFRSNRRLRRTEMGLLALATVVDLAAVYFIFWVLPDLAEQPLTVTMSAPDVRILVVAMGLGVTWGLVRTNLLFVRRRRSRPA